MSGNPLELTAEVGKLVKAASHHHLGNRDPAAIHQLPRFGDPVLIKELYEGFSCHFLEEPAKSIAGKPGKAGCFLQ